VRPLDTNISIQGSCTLQNIPKQYCFPKSQITQARAKQADEPHPVIQWTVNEQLFFQCLPFEASVIDSLLSLLTYHPPSIPAAVPKHNLSKLNVDMQRPTKLDSSKLALAMADELAQAALNFERTVTNIREKYAALFAEKYTADPNDMDYLSDPCSSKDITEIQDIVCGLCCDNDISLGLYNEIF
jgi:hypothetical protein